ncbi:FAM60A family protein [Megaselia abdita]
MFSFHKPRVYRSAEGCCICGAKSSSSRFTDSGKYEEDSIKCFNLHSPRKGEICNACVLLVKRYKRLPSGSDRHWGHVVDARSGPGLKSMNKFKKMKEDVAQQIPEKFSKIFKKTKKAKGNKSESLWDTQSLPPTPESLDSDEEAIRQKSRNLKINKRKTLKPQKLSNSSNNTTFVDDNVWSKRDSCCGPILENTILESIIFDISSCKPCDEHKRYFFGGGKMPSSRKQLTPTNAVALKKHHLFLKRQSESFQLRTSEKNISEVDVKTDLSTSSSSKIISRSSVNLAFSHKIKPENIKIVKHSLDKTKTLKSDIVEIKHLIKPLEKGCLTARNKQSPETTITPKYSDNSSDSGFDENSTHDRKSFSPEMEDKSSIVLSSPSHKTLYLSSGIEIQGQQQNLILTGNEVATKIFQSRRYQTKSKV